VTGNGSPAIARPWSTPDPSAPPLPPPPPAGGDDEELNLGKVLQALRRRQRLALLVLVASLLAGGAITLWQRAVHPVFAGSFRLLVRPPITPGSGGGSSSSKDGSSIESVALPGAGSTNTSTLIQVLGSPLLLEPVEKRMGLEPGTIESALTVGTVRGSRAGSDDGVLEVTLRWSDPQQGEAILRNLSAAYLRYSLTQRQEQLTQGLEFLDQQAPELQRRVTLLQNQLSGFRQRNRFVEPTQQAEAILGQRQALSGQLEGLQQQQARIEGRLAAVRRGELGSGEAGGYALPPAFTTAPGSGASVSASSGAMAGPSSVPATVSSLQELNQVERDLAEAEANFTDASPQVRELRARRDRLRPLLQRQQQSGLQGDLSQNLAEQREIQQQLNRLARNFVANPAQIQQYEALQQQLEVARDNLSSYIKARENFRLQVAQDTVPWSLLAQPSFNPRPVSPSLPRNLLLSLLLGSVGGVAAALLRDRLDHVFHDPRELREALPLPLLGTVPHLPGARDGTVTAALQAMAGGERFEIRESLRNLFANFRLLRADKTVRLVAITSATQGEGKSTTTALFAQTLAQLGQRVLLVDADMRRPMLHRYVGGVNQQGFSSLLTDGSLPVASTVITVQPGLDLLPAGPTPPDATRLLSSERCGAVLRAIRALDGYDLVLFDTPPALLLSDPVLLASHLDGLLFVVGIERVNRDLPGQALERMRDTGADVLGLLANLPSGSSQRRSGYGYGYGRYGYGYGYGHGYGSYAGYGGYAELASRYDNPSESGEPEPETAMAASGEALPPTTITRLRRLPQRNRLGRGMRTVVKWLDRRH